MSGMDEPRLRARVDELFAAADKLPGVVVAVQRGGDVVAHATGVADVETGRPMTPDTVFHLASVSKVYTATLVMNLVDEGLLDLDVPITTYLPDFTVSDDEATAGVTMRHLLTHTSGLDGDKFATFGQGDDALGRYVEDCRSLGQVHPLGATRSYCNSGLNIAGHVAATVAGASWDDALRDRVLVPSGAQRSGTRPEDVVWWPTAVPHIAEGEAVVPLRVWQGDRSAGPAGGVLASAEDVLRFVALHARGGTGPSGTQVLRPETVEQMLAPQAALPAGEEGESHSGLGWALRLLPDGRRVATHGGDLVGTHALMVWVPEAELSIAVLGNGDGLGSLLKPLVEELLEDVGIPRPEPLKRPDTPAQVDVAQQAGVFRTVAVELDLADGGDHLDGTLRILDPIIRERFPEEHREQKVRMEPVTEGQWLAWMPGADDPMPVAFYRSDGKRYLHLGGRAMVAAD
jgi:CubicO group peptidase (beta-lactamase class C family)